MTNMLACVALGLLVMTTGQALAADASPVGPDTVMLKDGSVIYGEVVEMSGGELHIKTAFGVGDVVKVKWANVAKLTINHQMPFHLKDGTVIVGTATEGPEGSIVVKAEPLQGTLTVPMDSIASVNPLVQPPVVYNGSLQVGFSQTTGNSHLRNASMIGEFVGRSEQLRLSLLGRYVYGDNGGSSLPATPVGPSSWTSSSASACSGSPPPTSSRIPFKTSRCGPRSQAGPVFNSSRRAISRPPGSRT